MLVGDIEVLKILLTNLLLIKEVLTLRNGTDRIDTNIEEQGLADILFSRARIASFWLVSKHLILTTMVL